MQSGTTHSTRACIGTIRRYYSCCGKTENGTPHSQLHGAGPRHPGCRDSSSLHECSVWTLWGPGSQVSEQQRFESVWGVVRLSVLTGWGSEGGVGECRADAPHRLPSCWHPVQGVLRGVNGGAHDGAHGRGLTRWAGEWAAVALQDARALPVVHVVGWERTEATKSPKQHERRSVHRILRRSSGHKQVSILNTLTRERHLSRVWRSRRPQRRPAAYWWCSSSRATPESCGCQTEPQSAPQTW